MVGHIDPTDEVQLALIDEVRHDGWVKLTLARPERRNALSSALADELVAAIERNADEACVVLSAQGPVFCAGADLSEGMSLSDDRPSSRIQRALLDTPSFVVAAVDGGVYGAGIGLVAACPVAIGTEAATFGIPEARRGVFPLGVVPYLEQHLSRRRLLELGVQGGAIGATEALACGLLTELVDADVLPERLAAWSALVAERPAVAGLARDWWGVPLRSDDFANRVRALEAQLTDVLAAPSEATT